MPSGSKKRKAARQKKQQQQHTQNLQPTSLTSPTGHGQSRKGSDSSSSDSDKDFKENENFSDSCNTEVVAVTQDSVGDHRGIMDAEVVGKDSITLALIEIETEIRGNVKEIGIEGTAGASSPVMADVESVLIGSEDVEVSEAVENSQDVDSLCHEIQVNPVLVFDESPVSELLWSLENGDIGERDLVNELVEVHETGDVVENGSVSELAQETGGVVENYSASELAQEACGVAENSSVSELVQETGGVVKNDSVSNLVQETGGVVENDSVTELTQETGVVLKNDPVSELAQEAGDVVENDSVRELPQSHENESGGLGDILKAPVSELNQHLESGVENSDRFAPTAGVIIEHRARVWNCCGLLDVFMGSR